MVFLDFFEREGRENEPRNKNSTMFYPQDRLIMAKKSRKHEQILGISISSTQKPKVLRDLRSGIGGWDKKTGVGQGLLIVTPNPEIINRALSDKNLAEITNSADYSLLDGVGAAQALKFLKLPNPNNLLLRLPVLIYQGVVVGLSTFFKRDWLLEDIDLIKGREFFVDLLKLANKKGWRVFLLGGQRVTSKMVKTVETSFKNLEVKGEAGPELTENGNPVGKKNIKLEKDIIKSINDFKPHLLFVGFTPPKQERWLDRWLSELEVAAAMTVGGTFDYMTGETKLPPTWMERLGLEWIWRAATQRDFKRVKRVLTAFPIFPLKVFWHKLTN